MKKILLILIIGLILFNSCKKGVVRDCFKSTGKLTDELRSIENFSSILLKDNVNLILCKSENNSIRVTAGSNLISGIITEVDENGLLEISNENECNWVRSYESPINVYLNYVDIDSIEYRSIGDIKTDGILLTDTLWLKVTEGAGHIEMKLNVARLYCALIYGTSDITLSGRCGLSYVFSASFGLIDMVDLESDNVYVNSRSSNNIYLSVENDLGAIIGNIGSIYYKGNPSTITLDKTGSGELIKISD